MSDTELELIKMRKLKELQKRLAEFKKEESVERPPEDPVEFLKSKLTGRGPEILDAALSQYPAEAKALVNYLVKMYKQGHLEGTLDDVSFYNLLRRLGLPVRLETKIVYLDKGEAKPIGEKFKGED